MNRSIIFGLVIRSAEDYARRAKESPGYMQYVNEGDLGELLFELGNRKKKYRLPHIPNDLEKAVKVLREFLKDDVTKISLVLHRYFPDKFFFYRTSGLEEEIFNGLTFLMLRGFEFDFDKVGEKGVDKYLQFNKALVELAHGLWPNERDHQILIEGFLYEGLGLLFRSDRNYRRYWLGMSYPEYFDDLDNQTETTWSARKDMQAGDLVFIYRTSPVSSITDVFEIKNEPYFDPYGAWNGFWVKIKKLCDFPNIRLNEMKKHSVLGEWGLVRKNFLGVVSSPVPYRFYNELIDKIPKNAREKHGIEKERLPLFGGRGEYVSEFDFEDNVVTPMLKRLNLRFKRQYPVKIQVGTQCHPGRVDFFVEDDKGPLTLFEDKFKITNNDDLNAAIEQARSYALFLGLPSFVVASPEGMWVHSLERNIVTLEMKIEPSEFSTKHSEMKELLIKIANE